MKNKVNIARRSFIYRTLVTATGLSLGLPHSQIIAHQLSKTDNTRAKEQAEKFSICIFSKQMHWLGYEALAETAAQIGFDGVDLTVRPKGHVLPEKVEADLPKAVKVIQKAGLSVPMITTNITTADDPNTEKILKTAHNLGIKYYRLGTLPYLNSLSIADNLERYKTQLAALAQLNQQYQLHGAYQNHAGTNVGAPVWDLWPLLQEADPKWLGCQYDIKHATLEGGFSWPLGFKLLHPYIKTMAIKDFVWVKKAGKWQIQYVPLGEGMVDFKQYFALIKQYKVSGPISLHLEYPLGGAENGAKTLTISKSRVIAAMQKDLNVLKQWLKEAQL